MNKALTYNTNIVDWSNPVTKGLMGAFRCNEGAGKLAINGYNNKHGSLKGTAIYGVGKYGKCVNYDASSGCLISIGTGLLDISKPLSFFGLIKINTIASFPVIFGCSLAGLSPYMLFLHRSDRSGLCLQVDPNALAVLTSAPSKNLTVGQWTHVGFTWNQTTSKVKLYQDGVKIADQTFTIGAFGGATTTQTYGIGSWFDTGTSLNFNGSINECLIFQREVTETEARQLYVDNNNIYL